MVLKLKVMLNRNPEACRGFLRPYGRMAIPIPTASLITYSTALGGNLWNLLDCHRKVPGNMPVGRRPGALQCSFGRRPINMSIH